MFEIVESQFAVSDYSATARLKSCAAKLVLKLIPINRRSRRPNHTVGEMENRTQINTSMLEIVYLDFEDVTVVGTICRKSICAL